MHEPTKGASVEDHVRHLRRYKGEFVRDLAFGTVRLPPGWLAPGDATLLALDALALLDAGQRFRFRELLGQCTHLIDLIEVLINEFIAREKSTGTVLGKNDVESLRRGRGPGRVRDLLFARYAAWPGSVPAELSEEIAAVLRRSLRDRQSHQAAAGRDPLDLKALIQPLMPEVRQRVLDWAAFKRLRRADADFVVSEVIDQLVRTVAEHNEPPRDLTAWTRSTARRKWQNRHPARLDTVRADAPDAAAADDVPDEVGRQVDLERRLKDISDLLDDRAEWYTTLTPARPADALVYRAAAQLVGTGDVELIEVTVRRLPEGMDALRTILTRLGGPPAARRAPTVAAIIHATLGRCLSDGP